MRSQRSVLTVTVISGVLVMARSVLGPSPTSASAPAGNGASAETATTETSGDLSWYLDPDAAYRAAARSGRPVFVDFFGTWCTNCRAFEKRTHDDATLHGALQNAVLLKIYDTSPAFVAYRDDPRFPELRVGIPFFVVTSPSRDVLYKTNDYSRTDEMVLFLGQD